MSTLNPAKKVWVVIVTYNGAPWIENCLHSVIASNYPVRIVLVDNCSTDSTSEIVKENFPDVLLIQNKSNTGFGAANNIAISRALDAGADYIFLLNQDTTVTETTIGNLIDAFDKSSGYGVLSPFHLNSDGNNYDAGFLAYLLKDYSRAIIDQARDNSAPAILPVQFVNAAAWMIPVSVLERIGGFASLFFHYGEDRDFVNRLHFNGFEVGVLNHSQIRHYRDGRNMLVRDWNFRRKVKYYFVGWLSRTCDINKSFLSGWTNGFIWSIKESINDMLHLRISTVFVWGRVFFQIFSVVPKILNHRKLVKSDATFKFLK